MGVCPGWLCCFPSQVSHKLLSVCNWLFCVDHLVKFGGNAIDIDASVRVYVEKSGMNAHSHSCCEECIQPICMDFVQHTQPSRTLIQHVYCMHSRRRDNTCVLNAAYTLALFLSLTQTSFEGGGRTRDTSFVCGVENTGLRFV